MFISLSQGRPDHMFLEICVLTPRKCGSKLAWESRTEEDRARRVAMANQSY